jgi:hypothetical protein
MVGIIFGFCNIDFIPDKEAIYKRLDNLEGCKDNQIYTKQIEELRALL